MSLIEKARDYASAKHAATNHTYDDKPYSFHLEMVAEVAQGFVGHLPVEEQAIIIAGCWGHDLIEDARETYNDVKKVLGEEVAEVIYAVTNEKGRNRKERANAKYYEGIKANPHAVAVKLADRIANVQHSINTGSRMLKVYGKEYRDFKAALYTPGQWEPMWQRIEAMLED